MPNTLTYNILNSYQPAYLYDSLLSYHTMATRSLRSANTNLLSVPRVRRIFASRGFSIAAPTVWNSLLAGFRNSTSADTFCRVFKTHCFQQHTVSSSGSTKCLRFGHWLTLCTWNIALCYLLTYLLITFFHAGWQSAVSPTPFFVWSHITTVWVGYRHVIPL